MRPGLRAALILAAVAFGVVAVRVWAPFVLEPQPALDWLRGMSLGAQVLAYLLAYAALTTVAVPAFVLAIVSGIAFGLPWGPAITFLAANVASNLHFLLGRALGAERIGPWLEKRGMSQRFDKNSIAAMLLVRAVPSPFLLANLACGAAGVRWSTFFFGSGLGLIPQTVAFTFFAAQVYAGVEGAKTTALLWALGGIGVMFLVTVVARRLRNRASPEP